MLNFLYNNNCTLHQLTKDLFQGTSDNSDRFEFIFKWAWIENTPYLDTVSQRNAENWKNIYGGMGKLETNTDDPHGHFKKFQRWLEQFEHIQRKDFLNL